MYSTEFMMLCCVSAKGGGGGERYLVTSTWDYTCMYLQCTCVCIYHCSPEVLYDTTARRLKQYTQQHAAVKPHKMCARKFSRVHADGRDKNTYPLSLDQSVLLCWGQITLMPFNPTVCIVRWPEPPPPPLPLPREACHTCVALQHQNFPSLASFTLQGILTKQQ